MPGPVSTIWASTTSLERDNDGQDQHLTWTDKIGVVADHIAVGLYHASPVPRDLVLARIVPVVTQCLLGDPPKMIAGTDDPALVDGGCRRARRPCISLNPG